MTSAVTSRFLGVNATFALCAWDQWQSTHQSTTFCHTAPTSNYQHQTQDSVSQQAERATHLQCVCCVYDSAKRVNWWIWIKLDLTVIGCLTSFLLTEQLTFYEYFHAQNAQRGDDIVGVHLISGQSDNALCRFVILYMHCRQRVVSSRGHWRLFVLVLCARFSWSHSSHSAF